MFIKFIIKVVREISHFLTRDIDDKKLKEIKEHHLYMIARDVPIYKGL